MLLTRCHASHMMRYVKVKKVFIVITIPKPFLNFRTGWSIEEHAFALSSKHTFPRLARLTLDELPQNQHEKASLACVRVQSPSGLALVPCALSMVDVANYDVEPQKYTDKQTSWCRKMFRFLLLTPYARRPAMKRLFCLKAKNGLGRFALSALPHYYWYTTSIVPNKARKRIEPIPTIQN